MCGDRTPNFRLREPGEITGATARDARDRGSRANDDQTSLSTRPPPVVARMGRLLAS
jgi:hypothetical protein